MTVKKDTPLLQHTHSFPDCCSCTAFSGCLFHEWCCVGTHTICATAAAQRAPQDTQAFLTLQAASGHTNLQVPCPQTRGICRSPVREAPLTGTWGLLRICPGLEAVPHGARENALGHPREATVLRYAPPGERHFPPAPKAWRAVLYGHGEETCRIALEYRRGGEAPRNTQGEPHTHPAPGRAFSARLPRQPVPALRQGRPLGTSATPSTVKEPLQSCSRAEPPPAPPSSTSSTVPCIQTARKYSGARPASARPKLQLPSAPRIAARSWAASTFTGGPGAAPAMLWRRKAAAKAGQCCWAQPNACGNGRWGERPLRERKAGSGARPGRAGPSPGSASASAACSGRAGLRQGWAEAGPGWGGDCSRSPAPGSGRGSGATHQG